MKRLILMALILFTGAVAVLPADADLTITVKEAVGKVQMLEAGKDWIPLHEGDQMPLGAEISTGFKSTAILNVGNALLTVKPLTQMKLTELVQQGDVVKTSLYLRIGKVRAEVNHPTGTKADFKLDSPVATASVRGTIFEFDGETLTVERGLVELTTPTGQQRSVAVGESTALSGNGTVSAPVEFVLAQTTVSSNPGVAGATGVSTSGAQSIVPVVDTAAIAGVAGSTSPVIYPVGTVNGTVNADLK
jgi:hypothetical protein